jgi:hypothetical protein
MVRTFTIGDFLMPASQPAIAFLPPPMISTFSAYHSVGGELQPISAGVSSNVWPSANRAIYVPIYFDRPMLITKLFVQNGATSTGNLDVGIYDSTGASNAPGARLASSGSTAQGTVSTVQEFDITDLQVGRGVYYAAMAGSSGTATYWSQTFNVVTYMGMLGCLQEATALPLPATATAVACTTAYLPMIGIAFRTLVA